MVTEIIEYKLKADTNEDDFLKEAENFSKFFKNTFKGFIDLEFTKGKESWINVMHWDTMEDVVACGEILKTGPKEIAGYSALTERESTKLTFLDQKFYYN